MPPIRALLPRHATSIYIPVGLILIVILTALLERLQSRARMEVIEIFRK